MMTSAPTASRASMISVSPLRLVSTRSNTWSMNNAGTSISRLITRLKTAAATKCGRKREANAWRGATVIGRRQCNGIA
jgi:hypothetical protein